MAVALLNRRYFSLNFMAILYLMRPLDSLGFTSETHLSTNEAPILRIDYDNNLLASALEASIKPCKAIRS
jgi:hypothetical protein